MSKIQSANSVSPLDAVNPLEEMSPGAAIGAEATYGSNAGALDVLETSGVGLLDVLPFSLPEGTGTADQAERAIAGEWTERLADGRVRKHDTETVRRMRAELAGVSEGGGVTADVGSSGDLASLLAAKIADVAGATEVGSALTEKLQTLQDGMREHFPARFEAAKAAAKEAREREVPGTKVDGK